MSKYLPAKHFALAGFRIARNLKDGTLRVFTSGHHVVSGCSSDWQLADMIDERGYVEIRAEYSASGRTEIVDLRDLLVEDSM